MKITVETAPKEIADLVLALQDRLKKEKTSPLNLVEFSIREVLQKRSHDTSEEK